MGVSRPLEQALSISVSASLPASDVGNATLLLHGAGGALLEVTAVDGLTGTFEVKTSKNGTWRTWECWQRATGSVPVLRPAGTTITLVDGDMLIAVVRGFYACRFKRAAGTSATLYCRSCEDVSAYFMATSVLSIQSIADCGEEAGSASATQIQAGTGSAISVSCKLVKIKANYDNAGRVYIGISGVTAANGSADQTTGIELNAGDELDVWVTNVNQIYYIGNNAGDGFTWIAYR